MICVSRALGRGHALGSPATSQSSPIKQELWLQAVSPASERAVGNQTAAETPLEERKREEERRREQQAYLDWTQDVLDEQRKKEQVTPFLQTRHLTASHHMHHMLGGQLQQLT
jgi:hypothetical protein